MVTVDCDVLEADGGTRTASINGSWIALNETFNKLVDNGELVQNPLENQIAAVSVGIVDGCLLYTSPSPRDAHESRMPSSA